MSCPGRWILSPPVYLTSTPLLLSPSRVIYGNFCYSLLTFYNYVNTVASWATSWTRIIFFPTFLKSGQHQAAQPSNLAQRTPATDIIILSFFLWNFCSQANGDFTKKTQSKKISGVYLLYVLLRGHWMVALRWIAESECVGLNLASSLWGCENFSKLHISLSFSFFTCKMELKDGTAWLE